MEKVEKHMDRLNAAASKFQGGAVRNSGPKSSKGPKASGDQVTNPSFYSSQDQDREQGGGTKNKFHDV